MNSEDRYTHESICKEENILLDDMDQQIIVTTRAAPKNNVGRPRKIAKVVETVSNVVAEPEEEQEVPERKDPMQRLMQIQKDKSELMDSFKELMSASVPQHSSPREKNHVDLFFESVSSSVKALSPKLIAETKMRVSQLICELELRALTESEANNQQAPTTAMVVSQENVSGTYILNQTVSAQHQQHQVEEVHHYEAVS